VRLRASLVTTEGRLRAAARGCRHARSGKCLPQRWSRLKVLESRGGHLCVQPSAIRGSNPPKMRRRRRAEQLRLPIILRGPASRQSARLESSASPLSSSSSSGGTPSWAKSLLTPPPLPPPRKRGSPSQLSLRLRRRRRRHRSKIHRLCHHRLLLLRLSRRLRRRPARRRLLRPDQSRGSTTRTSIVGGEGTALRRSTTLRAPLCKASPPSLNARRPVHGRPPTGARRCCSAKIAAATASGTSTCTIALVTPSLTST